MKKGIFHFFSTLLLVLVPVFYGHVDINEVIFSKNLPEAHSEIYTGNDFPAPFSCVIFENCVEQANFNILLKFKGFPKNIFKFNCSFTYSFFSIQKSETFLKWNPIFYLLYRKLRL